MLTIDQYDVLMTIKKYGITPSQEIYLDDEYVVADYNWVKNEFAKSFKSLKYFLNIQTWQKERNDCDNFSCGARFLANTLNKLSTSQSAGLAFGEFYYTRDSGGGHAINFFIHSDTGSRDNLSLDFYEPQTDDIVKLSEIERAMCMGLII